MEDMRLISIWRRKRNKNQEIKFHSHKYHELVYYVSGKGETNIGGKCFNFSGHNFAVIPPNVEHNEFHFTDSEIICIEFKNPNNVPLNFLSDRKHMIYEVLNQILNESVEQKYGYEKMITIQLNSLLLHIDRIQNTTSVTKDFSYIINYLRENFHENIKLSDCAKELNISYDYFQHKFKSITGFSPRQFLIEQRLLAAEKMLLNGSYSCTEIAYRCGFCTSAQFSAIFKNKHGISPLQYKN